MPPAALRLQFLRLFSLRADQADAATIDGTVRDGVQVGGTNLWVLICAIFVASVGLNVNATAVIIGAMLISPLMGPIIGIGYGAAINDSALMRLALRNLGIFIAISLSTSTLYFFVSPLTEAHAELLARTSPTIWDVLIAFFGGAAGMIGLSRKEKTNLVPGVAIATALMPPLCTAGYGLATGQPRFFLGAGYLFTINAVFIAFATLLLTRILHLPRKAFASDAERQRARWAVAATVGLTLAPSIYLAGRMVQDEIFQMQAGRYLAAVNASRDDLVIVGQDIDPAARRISLTLLGAPASDAVREALAARLAEFRLTGADLDIRRHALENNLDLTRVKHELLQESSRQVVAQLKDSQARVLALETQLRAGVLSEAVRAEDDARLSQEIAAQLGSGEVRVTRSEAGQAPRLTVLILAPRAPAASDLQRLKRWLAVRQPAVAVDVVIGRTVGQPGR